MVVFYYEKPDKIPNRQKDKGIIRRKTDFAGNPIGVLCEGYRLKAFVCCSFLESDLSGALDKSKHNVFTDNPSKHFAEILTVDVGSNQVKSFVTEKKLHEK